jgi:general secretion pathway protein G
VRHHYRKKHKNGFTLLELMIVIAIIGTLSAIAVPNYIRYRQLAFDLKAILEIKQIEKEITLFQIDTGGLPDSLADIGLDTLRDSWGNPYQYLNFETVKGKGKMRKDHSMVPVNTDYDLYSLGPDGKSSSPFTAKSSRDDIVRANNGQYIGSVSNY